MPGAVTVGELAVELDARTRDFNRKMVAAEKRMTRFEKTTNQSTQKAGAGFKNLLGPIAAVASALGAIAAIRWGARVSGEAITASAAFEGYEVRLKNLLNSQEAANVALENFVELSTKTPFAVSQIVSGAATLASVAGGSREELEELTFVSSNLAAVTGLSFEEASGNLQRALAGGISAAVLFRERGITKLIEDINGIPTLSALPLEQQRELFKKTFGSEALAPFGSAAEDLSKTLGGALSNIGDATSNASRALGDAFGPATFGAAKGVIIPFFNDIEEGLIANKDAIVEFTVTGLAGLIRGFAKVLDVGTFILRLLSSIGVDFSDIGDIIQILWNEFKIFFEAVKLGVETIVSGVALLAEGIGYVGNALGLVTDEEVETLRKFRSDSLQKLTDDAVAFGDKFSDAIETHARELAELTDHGEQYAEGLENAAEWARTGADNLEMQADAYVRLRAEQKAASDEAEAQTAKRTADNRALADSVIAEFEEIEREWNAFVLSGKFEGFGEKKTYTAGEADALIEGINEEFDAIDEEHLKWLQEHGEAAGTLMADTLAMSLSDALSNVAQGEAVNFAQILADLSGSLLEEALRGALSGAEEGLGGIIGGLGSAVSGLFGGGGGDGAFGVTGGQIGPAEGGSALGFGEVGRGAGGADWGAGISAGIGLGGSILAGALRGTDVSVSNPAIRSAVTSTQEVRGVVAGPSNIPIAEVGNAIRDAQGEQVSELKRSNALLQGILDSLRAGGEATGAAGESFASIIAGEMSGSVALG